MNLKEFVSQSLKEVFEGIAEAQKSLDATNGEINPRINTIFTQSQTGGSNLALGWSEQRELIHMIEFDVAVTATEGEETKAGIGVVANIFALGAQLKADQLNSAISRIQFRVPVSYPSKN